MIEKEKHILAFERYFALGDERTYSKLAKVLPVSVTAIKTWANSFGWKERAHLRDLNNTKELKKQSDKTVVATKADYRRDIKNSLLIIKKTILSAVDPQTKKLNITTKTPSDINALSAAYERLCKLDLLLVGEATDRTEAWYH